MFVTGPDGVVRKAGRGARGWRVRRLHLRARQGLRVDTAVLRPQPQPSGSILHSLELKSPGKAAHRTRSGQGPPRECPQAVLALFPVVLAWSSGSLLAGVLWREGTARAGFGSGGN